MGVHGVEQGADLLRTGAGSRNPGAGVGTRTDDVAPPRKLYVVTHRDLDIGYQAVQSGHAAVEFQHQHPELADLWHQDNYLIFLSAPERTVMMDYLWRAYHADLPLVVFREPDLNNEVTAFAALPDPGPQAQVFGGLTLLGNKPRKRRRRPRGTEWRA